MIAMENPVIDINVEYKGYTYPDGTRLSTSDNGARVVDTVGLKSQIWLYVDNTLYLLPNTNTALIFVASVSNALLLEGSGEALHEWMQKTARSLRTDLAHDFRFDDHGFLCDSFNEGLCKGGFVQ